MKISLQTFLQESLSMAAGRSAEPVNESFRWQDTAKAMALIKKYLAKKGIYGPNYMQSAASSTLGDVYVYCFWDKACKNTCYMVYTMDGGSTECRTIAFTNEFIPIIDYTKAHKMIEIELKGNSMSSILPIVNGVMNGKIAMNADAIQNATAPGNMYESMFADSDAEILSDLGCLAPDTTEITEVAFVKDDNYRTIEKKYNNVVSKLFKRGARMEPDEKTKMEAERDALKSQLKALRANSAQVNINAVTIKQEENQEDVSIEKYFAEKVHQHPKQKFDQMGSYIKLAHNGGTPLLLLCGAPGSGKTFNIKQKLLSLGYNIDHKNPSKDNCGYINSKGTAAGLYQMLFRYKNAKNVIVIDDCDSLVGPKASEDAINVLKAATDSGDVRTVSYYTSKPIKWYNPETGDDEDMPRSFTYEGFIIVITNYSAGQLDSAIRNRAFIQDLNFTLDDMFELITDAMQFIGKGTPLEQNMPAKQAALDYLHKIADDKVPIEISFRSFLMISKLYTIEDISEEDRETMILENLKLQFIQGGKHY